jgi:hypothetical protein
MSTTVEITLGDDGKLTVGIVDQPSAEQDNQTQAADVAQALTIAKHLLENPPDDQDGDGNDTAADGSTPAGQGAPADSGSGAVADASAAQPSGDAGASGPSAQAVWDDLAQQGPAH